MLLLNAGLLLLNLIYGSVEIPMRAIAGICLDTGTGYSEAERLILIESRMPAAFCAMLTGAALGACGLLLQSFFRNPLAGPSILGITSGAQLMVAIAMLSGASIYGASTALGGGFETVMAAMSGALAVLALLLWIGRYIRNAVGLLIVGILLSYLTSAVLTLLNYYASAEGVQNLMLWGMGSFSNLSRTQLPLYGLLIACGLGGAMLLVKPLNGWMLGEMYARNLGIGFQRTRWMLLICSGMLCAVTTAWCGPIAFIGLSIPHIARLAGKTDDHGVLLPLSILLGSLCCSLCLLISTLPDSGRLLPINAITPLLGIPVILWVIISRRAQ